MARASRALRWLAIAGGVVVLLLLIAVLILPRTEWAQGFARDQMLGALRDQVQGSVEIGEVSGNLLDAITLEDVRIEDTTGTPVFTAERVTADYSLRPLLDQRILLENLEIVAPNVILDQTEAGEWNVAGLMAPDTAAPDTAVADTAAGFGSWIRIEDASIERGHVTVSQPWNPPEDEPVDTARTRLRQVDGSLHVVREVRELDASLEDLVLAHPEEPLSGALTSLSAAALPFESPPARIENLEGRFTQAGDSLRLQEVQLELPESRLAAEGLMRLEDGSVQAQVDLQQLSLSDLAWLAPELPDRGSVSARLDVRRSEESIRIAASDLQGRIGDGRLSGRAEVAIGDTMRFGATNLRFSGIDASLAEELAGVDVPLEGSLAGDVTLSPVSGELDSAVRVDAELTHSPPSAPPAGLTVAGVLDVPTLDARDLEVAAESLRVALLEPFFGPLPIGGTLGGRVVVNGTLDDDLTASLDVTHQAPTGRTHVIGEAFVGLPGSGQQIRADLRLPVVSLATVGAFVPDAELMGTAEGTADVSGTLSQLTVNADLEVVDGGSIEASGMLALEGPAQRYDVQATLRRFDAGAVSGLAPNTVLNGVIAVEGEGAAAGPRLRIRADVQESSVASLEPVSADVAASLEEGLVRVEEGEITVASGTSRFSGTFGLDPDRDGTLQFQASVDSLSQFQRFMPADTAAGDSVPAAGAAPTRATPGAEPALPTDSLAGRLQVDGTVSGNLENFDVEAVATFEDLLAMGVRSGGGSIRLDATEIRTEQPDLLADFAFQSIRTRGFDFDSIGGRAAYRGTPEAGDGSASVTIVQDEQRDYRVQAGYTLDVDESEVRLEDVALRMDTVRWESVRPSRIAWGPPGIVVDSLHLSSSEGGRIFVDGRISGQEAAPGPEDRLVAEVDDVPISQVMGILQDSVAMSGILSLRLQATDLPPDARFEGTVTVADPEYDGTAFPTAYAEVDYVPGDLVGTLRLISSEGMSMEPGDTLLVAEGTTGIDLFGPGEAEAPRTLDWAIRVDSLPVEGLPEFTDAVSDVRGRVRADVRVAGTLDDPEPSGRIDLDLGRLDVDVAGVELRDIAGTVRLQDDAMVVDSLVGWSEGGRVSVNGRAALPTAEEMSIDIELTARDAQVLDNDFGQDVRANADLQLDGRLDSLQLGGQVRVQEGIIFVPPGEPEVVDLEDPLSQYALADAGVPPEVVPDPSPILQGLRANVELVATRNSWVRTSDGTAEVYTPEGGDPFLVQYNGPEEGVILVGRLNVDRGEYTFAGRRFELSSGTATFLPSPNIDPLLQLTAVHEVLRPGREALSIQINVGGRLQEPEIVLTSDATPPLSQSDMISYLVFGSPSTAITQTGSSGLTGGSAEELGALASQQLASMAIGALVEEAYANVEADAMRAGLDVFRVAPAELPEELALEGYFQNLLRGTQLELGTYLTPRLFLGASGRATTETWPGFTAEYRTAGGFRWTGLWEPRFLPSAPAFDPSLTATQTRALGLFLFWERRGAGRTGP